MEAPLEAWGAMRHGAQWGLGTWGVTEKLGKHRLLIPLSSRSCSEASDPWREQWPHLPSRPGNRGLGEGEADRRPTPGPWGRTAPPACPPRAWAPEGPRPQAHRHPCRYTKAPTQSRFWLE